MSALHLYEASGLLSFQKRNPKLCSFLRKRTSGVVSRGVFACMILRTSGDDAFGALARIDLRTRDFIIRVIGHNVPAIATIVCGMPVDL
jgi:hypothetical protein